MASGIEFANEFVDRRKSYPDYSPLGRDRRQFGANYDDLTPAGRELAIAIDRYKLERHRRFINADELLSIVRGARWRRAADYDASGSHGMFVDRRRREAENPVGVERRQFAGSGVELSEEGRELGLAIDQYKLLHRRRVVSPDELGQILQQLGYRQGE